MIINHLFNHNYDFISFMVAYNKEFQQMFVIYFENVDLEVDFFISNGLFCIPITPLYFILIILIYSSYLIKSLLNVCASSKSINFKCPFFPKTRLEGLISRCITCTDVKNYNISAIWQISYLLIYSHLCLCRLIYSSRFPS
jgi:hypothetical protein